MSETITEENITTVDHTSVTENAPGQEETSAADNSSAEGSSSAAESSTVQEASAADGTSAAGNTAVADNISTQENASTADHSTVQENVEVQPQKETSSHSSPASGSESVYKPEPEMDPFDKAEKERDSSGFFARFSSKIASIRSHREAKLVRDEIILSRIPDKDLMEYLRLEQRRMESQQHAREIREKRIWIAFQMTIALIAAVLVIYFLKDSPAILISILYTAGLLIAFNIWNKHKDGRSPKDQ